MSVLPARRALAGLVVLGAFALLTTSASAALDSKPPTKPGNLRVTAKTLTSVSMAWNASTDNSGNFSYRVRLWGDPTVVTLPKTQTSYTWTGLRPGVQYYFWVEAVDGSGNKSESDLLVVETVRDTTPPSPPGNLQVGVKHLATDPADEHCAFASWPSLIPFPSVWRGCSYALSRGAVGAART